MWTRRVLHLSLLSALIGTTACFSEITLKSYREGVRVNILCLRPKGGEIGRWRWTLKAFDKEEVSEVLQVSRYNGTITTNGLETLLSFPDGTRLPCSVTVACSWKGGGPAFDPWAIAKKTTLSGVPGITSADVAYIGNGVYSVDCTVSCSIARPQCVVFTSTHSKNGESLGNYNDNHSQILKIFSRNDYYQGDTGQSAVFMGNVSIYRLCLKSMQVQVIQDGEPVGRSVLLQVDFQVPCSEDWSSHTLHLYTVPLALSVIGFALLAVVIMTFLFKLYSVKSRIKSCFHGNKVEPESSVSQWARHLERRRSYREVILQNVPVLDNHPDVDSHQIHHINIQDS